MCRKYALLVNGKENQNDAQMLIINAWWKQKNPTSDFNLCFKPKK